MNLQNVFAAVLGEKGYKRTQSGESAPFAERRRHARIRAELPLGYSIADEKENHGGLVADASEGGLQVSLMEKLLVGTLLNIEILFLKGLEISSIHGVAKIVRSDETTRDRSGEYRYGLQFESFREGDLDKLKSLVKERGPIQ
jgi:c-di-GMP-binding flagellar brake protein YcgR